MEIIRALAQVEVIGLFISIGMMAQWKNGCSATASSYVNNQYDALVSLVGLILYNGVPY